MEPTKSTDLCQKIKNLSQRWLTGCLRRKSLWASTRCGYWVPSSLSMAAVDSVTDSLSLERVRWGFSFIGLHRWGFGSQREGVREKVGDQVREREIWGSWGFLFFNLTVLSVPMAVLSKRGCRKPKLGWTYSRIFKTRP